MVELVRAGRTPEELGPEFEQQAEVDEGPKFGETTSEKEEIRRLRPEVHQVRMEREKKAAASADYPITMMARVLEVSTSGFHAWQKRGASRRARKVRRALGLHAMTRRVECSALLDRLTRWGRSPEP